MSSGLRAGYTDGVAIKGIRKWRGLKSLVHDAVDWVTDLVDLGHESTMRSVRGVSDRVGPLSRPVRLVDSVRRFASHVRRVFCLGSPHRGAPLAKLGHSLTGALDAIDLPATQIIARILAGRSAGIRDLRRGEVLDEDWRLPDSGAASDVTWLPHARHYFVSATVTDDPDHLVGRLVGDLLVRVPSSSGPARKTSQFAIHTRRYGGILHHQMQNHPAVYEQLRSACSGE